MQRSWGREELRVGRSDYLLNAFPQRESHSVVWFPKQSIVFLADF